MEHSEFVAEGKMEIGPSEQYFTFLDGEHLGQLLLNHFGLPAERGYTDLGRVRLTVEWLEDGQAQDNFLYRTRSTRDARG